MEMEAPQEDVSRAERKQLRREEKERARQEAIAAANSRKFVRRALLAAIPLAAVSLFAWKVMSSPSISEDTIVERGGVHWHTQLSIRIKGESIQIPANVGIAPGQVHPENMHTHEADNVIHIEKAGIVTYDDLRLHHFFGIWEKQFNSECILDHCNGPEGRLTMTVNGQGSTDFENYIQRDGDRIEIRFE